MLQQVFDFLTQPGNGDRITGLVIAGIIVLGILSLLFYSISELLINLLKSLFSNLNFSRKDRIVEVPKYIEPPVNKEIEKYLTILKKIADNYSKSLQL